MTKFGAQLGVSRLATKTERSATGAKFFELAIYLSVCRLRMQTGPLNHFFYITDTTSLQPEHQLVKKS